MKKLILLLLVLPMLAMAQSTINPFEDGISLTQGLAKAKEAGKFLLAVYVDPAAQDADSRIVGTDRAVRFINQNFVAVKFVKGLKSDTYPVYLVYNSQGALVHKVVGETYAYNFIDKVSKALDPATQYYTLVSRFNAGERSAAFLKTLTVAASNARETANVATYLQAYMAVETEPFAAENLKFWTAFTNASNQRGFELLKNNAAKVDEVLGAGSSAELLGSIVFKEEFMPVLSKKKTYAAALLTMVKAKYANVLTTQRMDQMLVEFYEVQENWKKLGDVLPAYMDKYSETLSPGTLNYYAYVVQEYINTPELVNQALSWSKRSIELDNKDIYQLTYAKLLNKTSTDRQARLVK